MAGTASAVLHLSCGDASAPSVDSLSLCRMHGSHVDLSIADHPVKIYIGFVAGDAAPYPPPSDPRLSDIGRKPYPPPSAWVHPVRCISSSLASGHYLRFGFGPIIRLQLRLEPLFLFLCVTEAKCAWQHCRLRNCSCPDAGSEHSCWFSGLRGAAPPRSDASADDPWPCPSPRAGPFRFRRRDPHADRLRQSLHRTPGCAARLLPARRCSPRSSAGSAREGQMPRHAPGRRRSPPAAPSRNLRRS